MSALLITPGEPAGIGPDVVLMAAQAWKGMPLVVVADPDMLRERATLLNLPFDWPLYSPGCTPLPPVSLLPVPVSDRVEPGVLAASNAAYVLNTLRKATTACLTGDFAALVTGPVHKGIINESGIAFQGHTELFAAITQTETVVMTFLTDFGPVGLMTTHLPLREVASAITKDHVYATAQVLLDSLSTFFGLKDPSLAICGLNPHAGEGGHIGTEEIEHMMPSIKRLRAEGFNVSDPLSADTLFSSRLRDRYDAILSCYHDQALPVVKALGFGDGLQVSLGLPFLRVSVDHGTALSIAGTGQADPGSLLAALKQAELMVQGQVPAHG